MAKCELRIELDDTDRVYTTGDRITGRVEVHATVEVKCKALAIRTDWKTHGRGNVDRAKGVEFNLFEGTFDAGQKYSYPFDIEVEDGPSTYHGHYLNIDHYVAAEVDIPWAFDAKANKPFRFASQQTADELAESLQKKEASGCVGVVVSGFIMLFLVVVGVLALVNPFMWIIGAVVGAGVGGWWYFFKHLPAKAMGEVACELHRTIFAAGEGVAGTLTAKPPKDVTIEGITWKVRATESCTSGSGTNATTHTHVAYEATQPVADQGVLPGGSESHFDFAVELPDQAIYSVDLGDNKLKWTGELRVGLPRCADWVKKFNLIVGPVAGKSTIEAVRRSEVSAPDAASTEQTERPRYAGMYDDSPVVSSLPPVSDRSEPGVARSFEPPPAEPVPASPPAVSFNETAEMIWAIQDDPDKLERVVAAVTGLSMPMSARVQRREIFGGEDEHAYERGYSFRAIAHDPPLPMTLYVRHDQADDFEQIGGAQWQGMGTIVGWCDRRNRLLVRVE